MAEPTGLYEVETPARHPTALPVGVDDLYEVNSAERRPRPSQVTATTAVCMPRDDSRHLAPGRNAAEVTWSPWQERRRASAPGDGLCGSPGDEWPPDASADEPRTWSGKVAGSGSATC